MAFIRAGEKDDSGKPRPAQIAILSLTGGEARIITDLPKGACRFGLVAGQETCRVLEFDDAGRYRERTTQEER